jgi:hypothetical protein
MRPFCRSGTDTNCFRSLTLHGDETPSHGLRQFPELQILYVVEFPSLWNHLRWGEDWHFPCSIFCERES